MDNKVLTRTSVSRTGSEESVFSSIHEPESHTISHQDRSRTLKLFIFAIDAADFAMTHRWLEEGKLPHLGELARRGAFGSLRSTIPPYTPVAWTSFLTGMLPGKHGVYGFMPPPFAETQEEATGVPFRPQDIPTFYQALNREGMSVGSFNVPWTYPVEPLEGFVVAGAGGPDGGPNWCYPPELADELLRELPRWQSMPPVASGETFLAGRIAAEIAAKEQAIHWLMARYQPEILAVGLSELDLVQHEFLGRPFAVDETGCEREVILYTYQQIDDLLGRLLCRFTGENTVIAVVSDHGQVVAPKLINLAALLAKAGMLIYQQPPRGLRRLMGHFRSQAAQVTRKIWSIAKRVLPRPLLSRVDRRAPQLTALAGGLIGHPEVDWSRSRAVPTDISGAIYLRCSVMKECLQPLVPCDDCVIRKEVLALLNDLRDPDNCAPVFEQVLLGEDLYQGPRAGNRPDIVVLPRHDAYQIVASEECSSNPVLTSWKEPVATAKHPRGVHSLYGILFVAGPQILPSSRPQRAGICDVAPTLLHLLGCSVPSDMDGRVATEVIPEGSRAAGPVRYCSPIVRETEAVNRTGVCVDNQLLERLRGLGYW
ncbi:MAG: alkaline phosphatase family protein [Armatimonadetes bacterium]|nr:alkaline phosphatase family protein [Armatimonadota bacterium]